MKDIAIGTGAAGDVINKKQILNIVKGAFKPKNLDSLKKFVGTLELIDGWEIYQNARLEWT